MTQQTRATLKAAFEQGDTPQGSDYADLIDSFPTLADTTAQSMASDLLVQELQATRVSAAAANITANLSASSASFGVLTVGGISVPGAGGSSHGQLHILTPQTTAIVAASAFVPVSAADFKAYGTQNGFSANATQGFLEYTGTDKITARIHADISMRASTAAKDVVLRIARNGTTILESEIFRNAGTSLGAAVVSTIATAETSDTFRIYVANWTDTADLLIYRMNLMGWSI